MFRIRGSATILIAAGCAFTAWGQNADDATSRTQQAGPAADFEVYPSTPWNYAILPGSFEVRQKPMSKQPYSAESAPIEILAKGKRLTAWQVVDDSAGPLPVSPVTSKLPEETITLIPYGAAKLRITAFPVLAN